jgi:phage protein D
VTTETQLSGGTIKIEHNGSELTGDMFQAIEKVVVEEEINLPSMFVITFNIVNFVDGAFKGLDLETFKLGDEIKIFMGMDQAEEMMAGEITALEPRFGTPSYMEIRGFDLLYKLRFGRYRRSFIDMKDSDIASSIASDTGLTPDVEDTATTHAYLFQNNQTNYEFLAQRAGRIDYEMRARDKTFYFQPSQEDKTPEITLEYGIGLESFATRLRVITEGSEVEVRGWDVQNKEEITFTAAGGSERTKMGGDDSGFDLSEAVSASPTAIVDHAVVDATDAENIGKARYNSMIKQFMNGEGVSNGNPKIRAGNTIEIKGIGQRFSGIYYLTASTHSFSSGGAYLSKFKVKRTGI